MDKRVITLNELENYLWETACILRGYLDAADFKQYVFPLLFFKRISDVYDEEYESILSESGGDSEFASFRENHRFQIPDGCHWNDLRNTSFDIGKKIRHSMRMIEKNNELLFGIFGDANWTNKERMPDSLLSKLIEHISKENLSLSRVPADEFGLAYEYLIKKFADDSGHTAQEFYTNRTVVNLMTEILEPTQGESIYDPTCGTGGMLLNCVVYAKNEGKEYRNIKLYGQELNLITSAIAKMNMIVHGVDEFKIVRGDTLSDPKFIDNDRLQKFDVVLANPPYSISNWDQKSWINDRFGRNLFGTPPQGCADYAFFQHILSSLDSKTGRAAILFPHGVLFRDDEKNMRERILKADLIEGIIGIGPNLFYNSTMEACIVILKSQKQESDKGRIMFVDAHQEVTRKNAYSYIEKDQISKIIDAYKNRSSIDGFSRHVKADIIAENDYKLSIPLYLSSGRYERYFSLPSDEAEWSETEQSLINATQHYNKSLNDFKGIISEINECNLKSYRLDQIIKLSKKTVQAPSENGVSRYVGLEHIKPNETRIFEWGDTSDGISFTRLFEPGQVLFSKRRVYLRKAAIADFRGVCSGDILVAQTNDDLISPQYLVHIFHSDDFIRYALRLSAGGFSPRIRWKDIKDFHVRLPSLDNQNLIAEHAEKLDLANLNLRKYAVRFNELCVSLQQLTNSSLVKLEWPFEDRRDQ